MGKEMDILPFVHTHTQAHTNTNTHTWHVHTHTCTHINHPHTQQPSQNKKHNRPARGNVLSALLAAISVFSAKLLPLVPLLHVFFESSLPELERGWEKDLTNCHDTWPRMFVCELCELARESASRIVMQRAFGNAERGWT